MWGRYMTGTANIDARWTGLEAWAQKILSFWASSGPRSYRVKRKTEAQSNGRARSSLQASNNRSDKGKKDLIRRRLNMLLLVGVADFVHL